MTLSFWEAYRACAGGVILSVLIPSLIRAVHQSFSEVGTPAGFEQFVLLKAIWKRIKPFVVLGVFSLMVSVLIVAFFQDKMETWRTALIAGYLWDSTLQKITTGFKMG
jgi:hypothetical protein